MNMQSIHPAFLTVDHLGATVRWERGDTVIQGRLERIEHGFDLVGPDGIDDRTFLPRAGTLFTIQGAEPVLVHEDDDRARLTIIREAGA